MEPVSQLPGALAPGFNDRRTGLVVFGILEILLGGVCALFIPLMLLGQLLAARQTGIDPQFRALVPAAVVYAALSVVLIVLGIGSIQTRRWARALSLILGWSWLAIGAVAIVADAIIFRKSFGADGPVGKAMPEAARMIALITALTVVAVIFLLIPGALVAFYHSKHVKATCEFRDPVPRWTDKCPLPVLALSLWLAFGAVAMLSMPAYHSVAAFFGILISGWPGAIFYVGMAAIWLWCATAVYRLNSTGWWVILVLVLLHMASAILTFARVDLEDMYRLMGFPEEQIERMRQYSIMQGGGIIVWSAIGSGALIAYLLFVRKFFRKVSSPQ